MCKYPTPGRVKTRLTPTLTPDQAAAVARAFLEHLSARLRVTRVPRVPRAACPPVSSVGEVADTGGQAASGTQSITEFFVDPVAPDAGRWADVLGDAPIHAQSPGDLGDRLAAAAADVRRLHPGAAVLFLGLDSPDLPDAALARAADALSRADVVLGPTDDGGYWCLGLSRGVDPAKLLDGIDWSSGREFTQTLQRADSLGYATAVVDPWPDVDHAADLTALLARLSRSAAPRDRRLLDALHFLPDAVRPAPASEDVQ